MASDIIGLQVPRKGVFMNRLKYLESFKCIGGACEDNCCIGWDVDIDQASYKKYQKIKEATLSPIIKRYVYQNPNCFRLEIDYGKVELKADKRCPFLNASDLCEIHARLGESMLSNVCQLFPRIINRINGQYELSATPSCPEVARKLLFSEDALLVQEIQHKKKPMIITYDHDEKLHKGLLGKVLEVREEVLKRLGDHSMTLEESIHAIGLYLADLIAYKGGVPFHLNNPEMHIHANALIDLLKSDSGIKGTRYETMLKDWDGPIRSQGYEAYFNEKPFVLRNYLMNEVYQNLFPFTDAQNIMHSYFYLLARLIMMRRQLMGSKTDLTDALVCDYISSFSKAVDHHHAFKEKAIAYMLSKKV